jgi:hypothetical protein
MSFDFKEITKDISGERLNQSLIARKKVAKWEKYGLLEGLSDRRKSHMARLLENQAAGMLLKESSDTADIKGFQAIAFPLVRRVFGQLLAQEVASVQPMSLPSGLIFWLDFRFGTGKAGADPEGKTWNSGRSVFGDPLAPLTQGAAATGGHYNLHNSYTQREVTGTVAIASSASVTAWSEVDYDLELSAAVANSGLRKLTVDLDDDATITNIDETAFKMFAVSGTAAALGATTVFYRRHNQYNPTTKVLTMYYSGTALVGGGVNSGSNVTVSYVKKTSLSAGTSGTDLSPAWEYAYDNSDNIPEIDIKVASMPVTANDRKLKVNWTPELAQDLSAYHDLDAEAELTQVMADQVALDIDNEILLDMLNNARAATFFWDARPGFFVNREDGSPVAGTSFTGNIQEWYSSIMIRVTEISNTILRKNLRSGANFIVTSPDVCSILENLTMWRPVLDMTDPSSVKFSMGIEKAGTLGNRFTVYKVPTFPRNKMLVGYKGDEWLSTGYVYAPYIPLIVTPTVYDPKNFTPSKAVMTRYAKQVIRGDMYGVLVVKGLGLA